MHDVLDKIYDFIFGEINDGSDWLGDDIDIILRDEAAERERKCKRG
jgi:hypothetical protein